MYRTVLEDLQKWQNSPHRKPLLVTGIRQCGKTYILKQFGERFFEDVAYFYFEGNSRLASIFTADFDIQRIVDELGIVRKQKIVPGKTLVIFDEIQACPEALTSLKYFQENLPKLHVVCAGSLLGVALKRNNISFPVGKVERLKMYPMSFKEFLLANGHEALLEGIKKYDSKEPLPELYTAPLTKELKYYYLVGGLPEVVSRWVETHDFSEVAALQDNILEDYANDFAKYAPNNDVPKINWIWQSVPQQLAKENNKFFFSHVKEGKRSKDLEDALEWLKNAGLVTALELVNNPELPLSFNADASYFKVYLADVGLLCRRCGLNADTVLTESTLYKNFRGALTENYVLNELIKLKIAPYFWRSGNTAELDFLFEDKNRLVPVEAKAEIHTRAKSYSLFCKKYQPPMGFKMSMKNIGTNNDGVTETVSLPLYMLWNLKSYLH
ncbi:MAG: ATP-binding protein [Phascolarctobacterium sp.]